MWSVVAAAGNCLEWLDNATMEDGLFDPRERLDERRSCVGGGDEFGHKVGSGRVFLARNCRSEVGAPGNLVQSTGSDRYELEVTMRAILIVVGVAAIAYVADSYWYHGVYFAALRGMLSQILAHF